MHTIYAVFGILGFTGAHKIPGTEYGKPTGSIPWKYEIYNHNHKYSYLARLCINII